MASANVINYGGRRAIFLPLEFHIDADKVYIKRVPEGILVIKQDPCEFFYEGVEELSDGFMKGPRKLPQLEERDW